MNEELRRKLEPVKVIVTDVDGCLGDSYIVLAGHLEEIKRFSVKDGFAISLAHKGGLKCAAITARTCGVTARRCRNLGFDHIFQTGPDKVPYWEKLKRLTGVEDHEMVYLGDDLFDLCLLGRAGCSFCPSDAVEEVRRRVDVVLPHRGGDGAFRSMVEMVLKAQGKWNGIVEQFLY